METLKDILFAITHPSFWSLNHRVSKEWDKQLNELLENNAFKKVDSYTAIIGGKEVWTDNYPYASFWKYNFGNLNEKRFLPKRRTIYKAMQKYRREC